MTEKERIRNAYLNVAYFAIFNDNFNEDRDSKDIDLIASIVEKEIPKKPNWISDGYADGYPVYDTWICPNCGEHYETECDHYDYCPQCGQRIDWEE